MYHLPSSQRDPEVPQERRPFRLTHRERCMHIIFPVIPPLLCEEVLNVRRRLRIARDLRLKCRQTQLPIALEVEVKDAGNGRSGAKCTCCSCCMEVLLLTMED